MPFSRSQNSRTAKKSAFIYLQRHAPQGNKKVGRLRSSDFRELASQQSVPFYEKNYRFSQKQSSSDLTAPEKGHRNSRIFLFCGHLGELFCNSQSHLPSWLHDLRYRVQVIADADTLVECAEQEKPMVVLADLASTRNNVCAALARLKQTPATRHLPVIAFGGEEATELQAAAKAAQATLVVSDAAILNHLPQFLEQALQVE